MANETRPAARLLLVRHGETVANAARIVQTPDADLSARGVEQARRLAVRLAAMNVERLVSSDLRRAQSTAEHIAAATGVKHIEDDARLQERNFGLLRGRSYAEIGFDIMAPGFAPPGGESWEDLDARVADLFRDLAAWLAACSGSLVVVTHGLVCDALARCHLDHRGLALPQRWGNTSLTIAEATPPFTVRLLNCTAHLDGAPLDAVAVV
jgi:probable phosphoglycerate mutase